MCPNNRGGNILYDTLVEAGIDLLIGLPGTQTLPLDRVVAERDEMEYIMAKHETAIPHIAWGYYEASGNIAATLTIPGPGDTNAMHGLKNALDDCVPLIHISADSDPEDRGKGPIHEIDPDTYDNVVKANLNIEKSLEFLRKIKQGIEIARTPPYGPVRLGIPSGLLESEMYTPAVDISLENTSYDITDELREATELLTEASRPVVYVGGGARRSSGAREVVMNLVDALNAPVVASYKGKGVFPEDDPHFMGITATHLPAGAKHVLAAADTVLALGTDFDGVTTGNWDLPMGEQLIHVNLDTDDMNTAYTADIALVGDVADVGNSLLSWLRENSASVNAWNGREIGTAVRTEFIDHLRTNGYLSEQKPAKTPGVLRSIREEIPGDAIVTTGVGGFRLWAKQVFEAYNAESYITAGSWAGMGVGLPAAVGAKLAEPDRPVVSLMGDGGLMMCYQELHTAVEYDLDIIIIVFNNADYGIISKSPKIDKYTTGHRFEWQSPDFGKIAEGFGGRAVSVDSQSAACEAISAALARNDGPEVIEVRTETDESSVVEAADYESTIPLEKFK